LLSSKDNRSIKTKDQYDQIKDETKKMEYREISAVSLEIKLLFLLCLEVFRSLKALLEKILGVN